MSSAACRFQQTKHQQYTQNWSMNSSTNSSTYSSQNSSTCSYMGKSLFVNCPMWIPCVVKPCESSPSSGNHAEENIRKETSWHQESAEISSLNSFVCFAEIENSLLIHSARKACQKLLIVWQLAAVSNIFAPKLVSTSHKNIKVNIIKYNVSNVLKFKWPQHMLIQNQLHVI